MNLRPRYVVPALSIVCIAAALLFWLHRIHAARATEVAPYTAHLTITKNKFLPDGSPWNGVSTEVFARDRHGKTYEQFGNGSFFVQVPAKQQTLSWDNRSQVATLVQWPFWSGRKDCWADEHGQFQTRFGEWFKLPASPGAPKSETIASLGDFSEGKPVESHVGTENLGQKEIHGLTAYGTRMTVTPIEADGPHAVPEITSELWKSSELNLTLLDVTSGFSYGLERKELSDLQRGDPDPALFHPPHGYKVETVTYHQVPCEPQ